MIAVRLEGRLGNQLFQYAFIYSAAKKLNTGFYLDQSIEPYLLDKYFEVERDRFYLFQRLFSIQGYKNLFTFYLRRGFYKFIKSIYGLTKVEISSHAEPADELTKRRNKGWYLGYFQSERFFADNKQDLIELFKIKKCYYNEYKYVADQLPSDKPWAVVHIRRTDFLDSNIGLPNQYYHETINKLNNTDLHFIFISDDPDYVEQEFDYLSNKYISRNSEIIDFQFLIHADICILSSSSFSWWGAYLNKNKGKQVFAPKYWLGRTEDKEYPTGVLSGLNYNIVDCK